MLAGPYWYAIPCLLVVFLGLGTCSMIDVTEFDTFDVVTSVPDRGGFRHAVVMRQRHSDSGNTVNCVVIVAGPAPSPGPSRRLSEACALIAPDVETRVSLSWQANGRPKAMLSAGSRPVSAEVTDPKCYFETDKRSGFVCFNYLQIDAEVEKPAR
jgi:hypothetical protein